MSTLIHDVRLAVRLLSRSPGFTLAALVTLGLGIGANTLAFSLVDQTLLRDPPYPASDRLMVLETTVDRPGQARETLPWSYPKFVTLRAVDRVFERLAGVANLGMNLAGGEEAVRVPVEIVSAGYFPMLGVGTSLGRTFAAEEDREPGAHPVALVSHRLWQQRFGSDPGLVGRSIVLEQRRLTVVGIAQPGFAGLTGDAEVWVPMALAGDFFYPEVFEERWSHWFEVVGRLKPGVSAEQAQDAVAAVGRRVAEAHPAPEEDGVWGASLAPLRAASIDRPLATSMLVLMGAVGFVLLIACATVANLLVARSATRRREMAMRLALGGRRTRLVRQLLTESVLLAVAGGALGLLLSSWGLDAFSASAPGASSDAPALAQHFLDLGTIRLDGRIFAFNFALAALVGLGFGLVPALAASRGRPLEALKGGAERARTALPRVFSARNLLVAGQIAVATVLLAGAGLMVQTFVRLAARDPGFDPGDTLTFRIDPPSGAYSRVQAPSLHEEILDRLVALPGVEAASVDRCTPLSDRCNTTILASVEGRPEISFASQIETSVHFVGPDHFRVLGVPLKAGRTFRRGDRAGAPLVAVVSETAARVFFGTEEPVGQRIALGIGLFRDGGTAQVVGVVGDVQYGPAAARPRPAVYVPAFQDSTPSMMVLLRTRGEPLLAVTAARHEVAEVDSDLALFDVRTMEQRVGQALSQPRFAAGVLAVFAAVAVALAAMGIYGVMAFAVGQRSRELGVRIALGAGPGRLLRWVAVPGVATVGAGLGAGLAGALALTRVLESLLFEVSVTDPATFGAVAALLGAVALGACYAPARRVLRADPTAVLREQ